MATSILPLLKECLATSSLLTALAFTALVTVGEFGLAAGFPFAYLLFGFVAWAGANHFIEILERRAVGEGWVVFSLDTVATTRAQLGVVWLAIVVAVALLYRVLVVSFGVQLGVLFAAVATLALPSVAALLAVTRAPWRALYPFHVLKVMSGMGILYALTVAATVAVGALVWLAYSRSGILEVFAAGYAWLLLAHVTGAVAYARRTALGVYAPRSPEERLARDSARLDGVRRDVLDHAYGIAARGNIDGGLAYINAYVETEVVPLAARLWLFHEMTHWADPRPALAFGRRLAVELEAADPRAAAKVRLRCERLETQLGESSTG